MRVQWVRRERLPEASLALVVPAGADSVGSERAGLASLVARVLPEGAGGRDAREMATWLDGLGMHLGIAAGYDSMILRLHTLSEQLPAALDVLATVATAPEFSEAEVERCRGERLDAILRAADEPAEVAADVLVELVYGAHPYGRLTRGRAASVESLERHDLVDFHASRFSPGTATLVACGALPEDFTDLVNARFGGWRGGEVDSGPPADVSGVSEPGIFLVDRPGSPQSEIRVGAVGLRRGDPAEPAARVTNAILGGLFNSRLNLNLREEKGWTYGARSSLSLRRAPGPFVLRAAVETRVTADAVREMFRELNAMRNSPPTEHEMRTAAGALTRSLPLRFETNGQIADTLEEQVVYGLPGDYWTNFASRIDAVSASEVREVAGRIMDPAATSVVVVGDADAVGAALREVGDVVVREPP